MLQIALDQSLLLRALQRADREDSELAFLQDASGIALQGADHHAHPLRDQQRQPGQCLLIILIQPVETIEHPRPALSGVAAPAAQILQGAHHLGGELPPVLGHLDRLADQIVLQQQP